VLWLEWDRFARSDSADSREVFVKLIVYAVVLAAALPMQVSAQTAAKASLIGTWTFDLKQGPKKDGPRIVIVRQDSSASYGTQTVRWRVLGDSLALALGGEWVNYRLKLKGKRLTLSGGDLTEPVTFDLVGPPTPRPDSVPVPPDPDTNPS
jgi:hypothetical protein